MSGIEEKSGKHSGAHKRRHRSDEDSVNGLRSEATNGTQQCSPTGSRSSQNSTDSTLTEGRLSQSSFTSASSRIKNENGLQPADSHPERGEPQRLVYLLHECVFRGDVRQLSALIRQGQDLGLQDPHGNTALHLAVMLGRKECVHLLCAHGAPVKTKNNAGWSPLAEAISYGERQTISSLLRKLKQQSRDQIKNRKPEMIASLKALGDFVVDLKWDFTSWVPLVSKMLPSDVCKITKKGAAVRLDTTLVDFNEMKWERGDITFLYKGDALQSKDSFFILDNKLKVFQRGWHEDTETDFEDEVDLLMSSDIVWSHMSTKPINFTRVQSGWFFKEDRQEMVGNYQANFYVINGMVLETRKRREHLSSDDLRKNKALLENFAKGNAEYLEQQNGEEFPRKESLAPPPPCRMTWDEYINSTEAPIIGRVPVCKDSSKNFKATIAMSEDFPLTVDMLLSVLEVIAPQFKHFQKLRDLVELRLPPGFPVKVDLPIFPTISARITFHDFQWKNGTGPKKPRNPEADGEDVSTDDDNDEDMSVDDTLDDTLFDIPDDFTEDPSRFPDL